MKTNFIEYSDTDLKQIEKKSKQEIMELFKELNHEQTVLRRELNDVNNRIFDLQTGEYNCGYSDGMKRMLETIEKIFGK